MPWQPLPGSSDHDPERLGPGLDRLLRTLGAPAAGSVGDLFERWAELVGDGLAARARPVALREGTLILGVDDPAWASQLRFLEPEVLARLAEALGEGVVTGVEVRVQGAGRGRSGGSSRGRKTGPDRP